MNELMGRQYEKQKRDLHHIFGRALSESKPYNRVAENILIHKNSLSVGGKTFPLQQNQKIWVMGSGKAAAQMALALENKLGDRIHDGLVVCSRGTTTNTPHIRQMETSHPVPGTDSLEATTKMLMLTKRVGTGDIVLYVMSGGSSALLCLPPDEVSLGSIQQTGQLLLNSGANIHEMNTVRKHLSRVKGGRLALALKEARVISLVISDVPGDVPEDIGSGPMVRDPTTYTDAMAVLKAYDLLARLPGDVVDYLKKGMAAKTGETLKYDIPGHTYLLLGNARFTARQAGLAAEELGYSVYRSKEAYSGETHDMAKKITRTALSVLSRDEPVAKPAALIYFGESYLSVTGGGKGGRNQQLALSASVHLDGHHYVSLLSAGTDGRDGPTDAAGAICNGNTVQQARMEGLDPALYLRNNDSYRFFEATGALVKTGDTGNNVMDMQIALVEVHLQ
ncbi:MAG: glycerate kinase [Balneolales bacterium]